jgi:hypothetical protein
MWTQLSLLSSYRMSNICALNKTTVRNAVLWNVTPCGSCKNRRFGGTYLHLQGQNNQRTMGTLAITSNCSTLRSVNNYMRKEAVGWDILCVGQEGRLLVTVFLSSRLSVTVELWWHNIYSSDQVGWQNYFALHFCSRGFLFESRHRHLLFRLNFFVVFRSTSRQMSEYFIY